jgi:alkanesulfonate monooxygenase
MGLEFIGFIGNHSVSEIILRDGPAVNRDYIETVAKAHELGGFDRALLAFHSWWPDSLQVGQHAASVTKNLGIFIAQRPGFTAPTVAARQFATLDALYPGRFSINIITGGDHAELIQDGNTVPDKDDRYARTNEFLDIVRSEWTSEKAFDYEGKYYNVKGAFSHVRPAKPIDVFTTGSSEAAIDLAGRHADIFALWAEDYEQTRTQLLKVRAAAAKHGRPEPEYSLSLRPIIAETEKQAWEKAEHILEKARKLQEASGFARIGTPPNVGSQRLVELAKRGKRHDKYLWTGIAELTGAKGNSTALVGTPDQVAEGLLDYWDLGVQKFLIRGFDPLVDAIEYGREILPRVRDLVARHGAPRKAA